MYGMLHTRPDLSYAVALLAMYCAGPKQEHQSALRRVFGFLNDSIGKGLQFYDTSNAILRVYCDASYAENSDRKSTTGFVCFLGDTPISWKTLKQKIVTISTM